MLDQDWKTMWVAIISERKTFAISIRYTLFQHTNTFSYIAIFCILALTNHTSAFHSAFDSAAICHHPHGYVRNKFFRTRYLARSGIALYNKLQIKCTFPGSTDNE